jgi:integrase
MAASINAAEAKKARNTGEVIRTPEAPDPEATANTVLLSHALKAWADEKARTSWVAKTEHEHRVWSQHFLAMVGDRSLPTYSKSDSRAFKSTLLKLPANWNKYDALKGLTIHDAAIKAEELGLSPMSDSNVNKLLGFVGSFWSWAEVNIEGTPPNLFRGLKIKRKRTARDLRDPFSAEELKAIFSAPLYTGCQSARGWRKRGDIVPRDTGMFWVPIVSLFTGARLGEIVQLYVEDIREENGIPFFDINDNGPDKRLKTAGSKRYIPIHPTLVELGFLDLVEHRRKSSGGRLFPDLKMGKDGYYSSPFSKRFSNFLETVGVKHQKNAFHSFRHCFEDACREVGVSKEIMDRLQGHVEPGMSGRYGRGFSLQRLQEAMVQVRYAELDLNHLKHKTS